MDANLSLLVNMTLACLFTYIIGNHVLTNHKKQLLALETGVFIAIVGKLVSIGVVTSMEWGDVLFSGIYGGLCAMGLWCLITMNKR